MKTKNLKIALLIVVSISSISLSAQSYKINKKEKKSTAILTPTKLSTLKTSEDLTKEHLYMMKTIKSF